MTDPLETKTLESAPTDLKVYIGSDDDQVVEEHHSVVLARYSPYIDKMLASPMKEATSREIHFPDITPKTWRKMISLLEDPVAAHQCSVKDAIECMCSYDEYDFIQGRSLCEHVLLSFLEGTVHFDISTMVDAIRFVRDANLEALKPTAVESLMTILNKDLTVEGFQLLAPLISPQYYEEYASFLRTQIPILVDVYGAGVDEVNGTYEADGYFDNGKMYVKEGTWEGANHRFCVCRCLVSNNTHHWYISIVPASTNPGTAADVDFYTVQVNNDSMRIPPVSGWDLVAEGRYPAPMINYGTQSFIDVWNSTEKAGAEEGEIPKWFVW